MTSYTWAQEYVGQQVGVTKTDIYDIETGKQNPSYGVLVKLENLFGLSHRYLLSQGSDHPDYSSSGHSGMAGGAKGLGADVEPIVDKGGIRYGIIINKCNYILY